MNRYIGKHLGRLTATDLIEVLTSLSRPVATFRDNEQQSQQQLQQIETGLDETLEQHGGLLNDSVLQPLTESPLGDAPLKRAVRDQKAAVEYNAELPASRKPATTRQTAATAIENSQQRQAKNLSADIKQKGSKSGSARDIKTLSENIQEQKSAKQTAQNPNFLEKNFLEKALLEKTTAALESKAPIEQQALSESLAQQQQQGTTKKARKPESKTATTATKARQATTVIPITTPFKTRKSAKLIKPLSPQSASELFAEKYSRQGFGSAWTSPLGTQTPDKNTSGKPGSDIWQEKKLEQTETRNTLAQTDAKLQKQLTQLLDNSTRSNTGADVTPQKPEQLSTLSNQNKRAERQSAFTPAPADTSSSASTNVSLGGLRGLAARAQPLQSDTTVTNPGATNDNTDQVATTAQRDNSNRSSNGDLPQPQASSNSSSGDVAKVNVAELAEMIAKEARRAGIDLEQFRP